MFEAADTSHSVRVDGHVQTSIRHPGPLPQGEDGEETHADVNDLLRNYFSSLEAKDEDIFRLYEDNQRLRDLVEASCAARQELDARLNTTQLLVTSLNAELNEKRCLIEAQDAESCVFREGIADLRVLLGKPSELDCTLDECVAEVEYMIENDRQRQRESQRLSDAAAHISHWAFQLLDEAETRERAALEETALTTARVLITSASLSAEDAQRIAQLEDTVYDQQSQLDARYGQCQAEADLAKQTADATQRELVGRLQRHEAEEMRLRALVDERQRDNEVCEMCLRDAGAVMDTLAQRAQSAEALLVTLQVTSRTGTTQQHAALQRRCAAVEESCEAALQNLAREREMLVRVKGQLEKETHAKVRLEAANALREAAQEELDVLKLKYTAQLEKANLQRQRQALLEKKYQENLSASEDKVERHMKQAALLQLRLDHDDEALQRAHREIRLKEKQQAELEATVSSATTRITELDTRLAKTEAAMEWWKAQTHRVEREFLAEMEHAARTAVDNAETHVRVRIVAEKDSKGAQQSWKREHDAVVDAYKAELQAWAAMTEAARADLRHLEKAAEGERAARVLLEDQLHHERILQHHMMALSSNHDAALPPRLTAPVVVATGSAADEGVRTDASATSIKAATVASLRDRIEALEELSALNAATIRDLRRTQHEAHTPASPTASPRWSPLSSPLGEDARNVPARHGGYQDHLESRWTLVECALLDRIDRAMDATSNALVTTPSRER